MNELRQRCIGTRILTIDSFDRNRNEWPSTNQYRIHLGSNPDENGAHTERVYQNVKSIQLWFYTEGRRYCDKDFMINDITLVYRKKSIK